MRKSRALLVLVVFVVLPVSASAGILFKKTPKPKPEDRVPELIGILQTEKDEHKRASAAEEIRQFDPATFPDIIVVLADVVINDPSSSVRTEAADSLGRMRPATQQAGQALEQALAKDGSMKVRMQARYSLLQLHWGGYHSSAKEPPLATKDTPVKETKSPPVMQPPIKPQTGPKFGETPPPPLAPASDPPPPPKAPSSDSPPPPKALPKGPASAPPAPADSPAVKAPPTAPPSDQGPELTPPE
jgi:HEAT repeats